MAFPRLSDRIWLVQMVFKEAGWMPISAGLFSLLLWPWSFAQTVFTVAGIYLASGPYRKVRTARQAIAGAMAPFALRKTYLKRPIARVEYDVVYRRTSARPLKLDIYTPQMEVGERLPAVIVVHGGSWELGDKGDAFGHQRQLAQQGFIVFDIQYRFSHEAVWPAQLEDVRAAIRWVKQRAEHYNADPERVALLGRSAGGHLALQAAYRATGEAEDTRVAAVVAYYPPVDFRLWRPDANSVLAKLIGGLQADNPPAYADASVTSHLHADVPPTLLIHGLQDGLVPVAHSHLLHNRLVELGRPQALLTLPWAEHGFDFVLHGLGRRLVEPALYDFLHFHLG